MRLSTQEPQLLPHLGPADLGIADGRLNRGSALLCDMPQIVRNLFQGPACVPRAMGKIMAQIVKGHIPNQRPFVSGGLLLEGAKPLVDAIFGEMWAALRGKGIRTALITPTMLEIEIEGAARLILRDSRHLALLTI